VPTMENEKKLLRELKRDMKRVGKKKVRNYLKIQLRDNPEEAPYDECDFGKWSTEHLNGKFPDLKRIKDGQAGNTQQDQG